ncbi:MAG: hypothetical protein IKI03_10765, partial [Clostridia bacterium]|nr:hypothetical protein [Clostridia bacterium]
MKTRKILRGFVAFWLVLLFIFSSVFSNASMVLADDYGFERTAEAQENGTPSVEDPGRSGTGDETGDGSADGTRYVWDDGKVRVTAVLSDEGAIPVDSELIVSPVGSTSVDYDYDAYLEALNAGFDSDYDESNTLLFDVAFIKDGIEFQPASGSVSVTFEFLDNQLADLIGENNVADVNVVHLSLSDEIRDDYDTTADASDIDAGNLDVEKLTAGENNLQVDVAEETVTFETIGFSIFAYTVDFEYTDPSTGNVLKYNLEGAGSISLRDLAILLGLTTAEDADVFISNVENVTFSNESLVSVIYTPENGWILKSNAPFSSEEKLIITLKDGTVIEIKVTDVRESDDLADFLVNAVVVGATQDEDGSYEIEPGKDYPIILSFAEDSTCQFANHSTLTYQIPEGLIVTEEQTGSLKINIVYQGRTYQVDATYDLTTNGVLSITFDQTDPDFPRLCESTNVSFRYRFYAEFDGENTVIRFSEDIERDIIFNDPDPGQTYAEKSAVYDETTGTFHYTITVTATGDVTDVLVKDTVLGNALIVDPASVVITGNSSSYTGGMSAGGFEYTFASMNEGEVITIKYDAAIDFSEDTDGDGKITADQTKNSVSIDSEPGDPHNSDYSREITYKYTVKKDGTEAGVTTQGDKIIDWEIEYNPLALVAVGGDTVTDAISGTSTVFMKYYGSGITVDVYDKAGNLVESRNVNYSDLTNYSDSTWTYTIPATDTTPYSYVIRYQTVVDMAAVAGHGVGVDIDNTANGDHGAIHVAPDNEIEVNKEVESYTTEEITWNTTFSIPQDGLTEAVVTDYLPRIFLESGNYYDLLKEGTLEITGLLPGESYEVTYGTGSVVIKFFKDEGHNQEGLQPFPGGRNVNVRLTTLTNQDWLQIGYETGGYEQGHTNSINLNGKFDTAQVIYGKPGLEKTVETPDPDDPDYQKVFKYSIFIKGLKQDSITVTDTFDTALLEVDTSKIGEFDHMRIYGGTQWSQTFPFGGAPVSYTDTENGIIITANSIPKDASGQYYSYYRIDYYLKLKEGVDLEQFAIANGGEYDVVNNALWADHDTECTYKVVYDALDKELLNAGELGDRNRTAQYRITFNTAKATLNEGEPMEMVDVLSSNLSVDYSSIRIVTDPEGVSVPYSLKGGKDDNGVPDGTTVATFIIPDATKVVVTYNAEVRGNGSQTIVNKVTVNGYSKTDESHDEFGDSDEGEGAVASFKIVKVDGYDANKKLSGVRFRIFAENPNLDFGEKNGQVIKELILETDENGEIVLDGEDYIFYFNETYHVREIEPPENYGTIGFDYLVTLTNDMALVDYGHYIYYFSDTMQIKNWPLEGLVVEKQVHSDDEDDLDRYYTFRVSILNEDGTVNTDYNEKNGDDLFVNGVTEFQIKADEQKMFWGFLKGTRYLVEEIDAEGFATAVTYSVFDEDGNVVETVTASGTSHTGVLTQQSEVVVFTNSKIDSGSLKIRKNVTVNDRPTTGTSADGIYTFTISG